MESRQQFTQIIGTLENKHFSYMEKLFSSCPDDVIKKMGYTKIPAGYTLIHAGSPCDYVYIILRGKVSGVDLQNMGNVYIFMEYSETEILGDYEIFGDFKEYRVSIRSTTECEVLTIPASVYLKWMQQDINALFMRTRNLMNTLTNQTSEERKYLFLECKDRLLLYLMEIYEKKGNGKLYRVKKTQSQIAERIGFNVRTIQRNIQSLEKEGFLTVEMGKICISREQYLMMKDYIDLHLAW